MSEAGYEQPAIDAETTTADGEAEPGGATRDPASFADGQAAVSTQPAESTVPVPVEFEGRGRYRWRRNEDGSYTLVGSPNGHGIGTTYQRGSDVWHNLESEYAEFERSSQVEPVEVDETVEPTDAQTPSPEPAVESAAVDGPIQHALVTDNAAWMRLRAESSGRPSFEERDRRHGVDSVPQNKLVTWLGSETGLSGGRQREVAHVQFVHEGEKIVTWTNASNFSGGGPMSDAEWERHNGGGGAPGSEPLASEDASEAEAVRDIRDEVADEGVSEHALTGRATEAAGYATVTSGAGAVGLEVLDSPTGHAVGRVYPGDKLPLTGAQSDAYGTTFIAFDRGEGVLGWVDSTFTDASRVLDTIAVNEQAAENEEWSVIDPAVQATEGAPGLEPVGWLVGATAEVSTSVYATIFGDQSVGTLSVDVSSLVPRVGPGSDSRWEIGFEDAPGYVDRAALAEASELDVTLAAGNLSEADVQAVRARLATDSSIPDWRKASYYRRLSDAAATLDAGDTATFSHGQGELTSALASCLQYLGIPNPYPDTGYADALEMIRLEQGMPAEVAGDRVAALAEAFGVSCTAHTVELAAVSAALESGQAVMVTRYRGASAARVRAVEADVYRLESVYGAAPEDVPSGDLAGESLWVFGVSAEADADPSSKGEAGAALALDAEQTAARWPELYAEVSPEQSAWYAGALSGDRAGIGAEAQAYVPSADDIDRLCAASDATFDDAFGRVLAGGSAATARPTVGAAVAFLAPLVGRQEMADRLERSRSRLQDEVVRMTAAIVSEMGPEAGASWVAWLGAQPDVAGSPLLTESVRDRLKEVLVVDGDATAEGPWLNDPSTPEDLARELASVDLAAVNAVPLDAVYGPELQSQMRDVMDDPAVQVVYQEARRAYSEKMSTSQTVENTGWTEDLRELAGYDRTTREETGHGQLPGLTSTDPLEQAWYILRFSDVAGWEQVHAACVDYFQKLEATACIDRSEIPEAEGSGSDIVPLSQFVWTTRSGATMTAQQMLRTVQVLHTQLGLGTAPVHTNQPTQEQINQWKANEGRPQSWSINPNQGYWWFHANGSPSWSEATDKQVVHWAMGDYAGESWSNHYNPWTNYLSTWPVGQRPMYTSKPVTGPQGGATFSFEGGAGFYEIPAAVRQLDAFHIPGYASCFATSAAMLNQVGAKPVKNADFEGMVESEEYYPDGHAKEGLINFDELEVNPELQLLGYHYLRFASEQGFPVMTGITYKDYKDNSDHITDHWIMTNGLVSSTSFRYLEPGTSDRAAVDAEYNLIEWTGGMLRGKERPNKSPFVVSWLRPDSRFTDEWASYRQTKGL